MSKKHYAFQSTHFSKRLAGKLMGQNLLRVDKKIRPFNTDVSHFINFYPNVKNSHRMSELKK